MPGSEMQSGGVGNRALRGASRTAAWVAIIGLAVVLVAVVGALGAPVRGVGAPTASPAQKFASITSPSAVAATADRLVVLSSASCSTVYTVAANGSVSTFAKLSTAVTQCPEPALAISPGVGNFPAGEVFVLLNGQLFEIPANGSSSAVNSSLALTNLTKGNLGLTFDTTGNFGYTLIATGGDRGNAVEIDAANQVRAIGSFHASVEGPGVAPLSFGSVGGDLLVAQSYTSTIYAMNATGAVRTFASFGSPAESIGFVPALACSYGATGDAYFMADRTTNSILAVPSSSFSMIAGLGFVLGEAKGAGVLHPNGTTTSFLRASGTMKSGAFVACPSGVTKTLNLQSRGLNGTNLNLIGYDPAAQVMIGVDPTTAPSEIFLLNASGLSFVGNVSTGLDPAAVAYNPTTDTLFVANTGSDNLTVLNASTFQELGNVSTGNGSAPVGVAYNTGNQKLYVANSGTDTLDAFSLANRVFPNQNQVISLAGSPVALVVDPHDGNTYVVGNTSCNSTVWEVHGFKVIRNLTVGSDARAIAVNNGTGALYVTVYGSNAVAILAPGDNLTASVAVTEPIGVAFDAKDGLALVDGGDGRMTVFQGTSIIATYLFGANPGPLVYDPVSAQVYGAADVTVFGIDPRIIIGGVG